MVKTQQEQTEMSDPSSASSSSLTEAHSVIAATPDIQASDTKKAKLFHTLPDQPEAGPSKLPPTQPNGAIEDLEPPEVNAIPLAEIIEMKEDFYDLKMSWSGKVYEIKVGGNDM